MEAEDTYQLDQAVYATWNIYRRNSMSLPNDPPHPFLTRVKRLLEADRKNEAYPDSALPYDAYAFMDAPAQGSGHQVQYTRFNVFCLSLAISLWDAGYKQGDIIFLLRHIRSSLNRIHAELLSATDPGPFFAVLRRIKMKDLYPAAEKQLSKDQPLIVEPVYCQGADELSAELSGVNLRSRASLVVELAEMAQLSAAYLNEAPVNKRGRR